MQMETDPPVRKSAVRSVQMASILEAAEEIFATRGFSGATMQQIATRAALPKANVHYYFRTKRALYEAVLERVLTLWTAVSVNFGEGGDPTEEFSLYIRRKLEYSFNHPYGSKVWANEVIHGAPLLNEHLSTALRDWEREIESQIKNWIDQKKIAVVNPRYLLYMIWACTQHFADFEAQIQSLNDGLPLSSQQREEVIESVTTIFLRGLGLAAPT